MNNNNNKDKYLINYEQHQLLQSTAPSSINAVVLTSSPESTLIACEAEMCDAMRRRRRSSKGSRRTMPTTLLNANPSNFRALVQKFTGRSAAADVSIGKKGPVTLDFRSPASVSKEVIFPSSGDIQNYDFAINGESNVALEWEGKETAPCEIRQLSNDYVFYGGCDDHAHGHHDNTDDDDLLRECLGNSSSFNGVHYMDYDDYYHDVVLLEEFMMTDLDT